MKAKDLTCYACGEPPADVDREVELTPKMAIAWACINGHRQISGYGRRNREGLCTMPLDGGRP